jgi:hypothetical protein
MRGTKKRILTPADVRRELRDCYKPSRLRVLFPSIPGAYRTKGGWWRVRRSPKFEVWINDTIHKRANPRRVRRATVRDAKAQVERAERRSDPFEWLFEANLRASIDLNVRWSNDWLRELDPKKARRVLKGCGSLDRYLSTLIDRAMLRPRLTSQQQSPSARLV